MCHLVVLRRLDNINNPDFRGCHSKEQGGTAAKPIPQMLQSGMPPPKKISFSGVSHDVADISHVPVLNVVHKRHVLLVLILVIQSRYGILKLTHISKASNFSVVFVEHIRMNIDIILYK